MTVVRTPESDLDAIFGDPRSIISQISGLIPVDERWRFLTLKCAIVRQDLLQMLDVREDEAVNQLLKHLNKIEDFERQLFLRNYCPKMKPQTQADLERHNFELDDHLLESCVYDIVDAEPIYRKDFLWKMGIESSARPRNDTMVTRREFEGVLQWWFVNQAQLRFVDLGGLLHKAKSLGRRDTAEFTSPKSEPQNPSTQNGNVIYR